VDVGNQSELRRCGSAARFLVPYPSGNETVERKANGSCSWLRQAKRECYRRGISADPNRALSASLRSASIRQDVSPFVLGRLSPT
jgi:hypothetical protein